MTAQTVEAPGTGPWTDPRAGEILDIIAQETGIERALLLPEAGIEALGIPSLDMTQAVFELETHFDIEIPVVPTRPSNGGGEFATVGDLVAHVLDTIDRVRRPAAPAA